MAINFTPSASLDDGVNAIVGPVTYLQLHTGDPGAVGNANVASGVSRAAASFGASSGGAATASVSFTIPAAGGPYTAWTGWTAATGGTFRCSGAVNPANVTFETSGAFNGTVTYSLASS